MSRTKSQNTEPLASRMRPTSLDNFVGQKHLVGEGKPIRKLIESDQLLSMIFWGPPGCGKTTLARIIANETKSRFVQLSAVDSGKDDVRKVVELAKGQSPKEAQQSSFFIKNSKVKRKKEESNESINQYNNKTILFLDEIHRFNKAQQDFLLPYVENGTFILIGATTENPSFEVISALLSRCRVFVFNPHTKEDIRKVIARAVKDKINGFGALKLSLKNNALELLYNAANGDPRTALNALELAVNLSRGNIITKQLVEDALQHKALLYDKHGEEHYNLISALHKSMRSSDPDAAVYWTARMLEAGEDPLYLARRMLRFASEDIGNADFRALLIANAVFEACDKVGMPECNVFIAQLAIYLARAPKDNSAYVAYSLAKKDAFETLNQPVPLHLRNAPTKLMKEIGYGDGYIYDHDVPGKKSGQQCLPDELKNRKYVPAKT